ncbi:MAG: hypothetical protein Q4B17_14945, partial [Lautropia sp.]|nr:hypothetical protein [Lautropia sp.]
MPQSHDQDFKNLILDYPLAALAFFVPEEARRLGPEVRIIPVRQEQLKDRLSDRFFELDVPLLARWPNGEQAELLFVLEEETDPRRFSIHRLGVYCLQLAQHFKTNRVVPVVIFLKSSTRPRRLRGRLAARDSPAVQAPGAHLQLGGAHRPVMDFQPFIVRLDDLPAAQHLDSPNIVARITLPCMRH